MLPFPQCPTLNAFGVRLGGLAKKSSLRARCRCSRWQSSTLDLGGRGVRHMHTSLAEATLFRKHRNQISTWSCSFSSLFPALFFVRLVLVVLLLIGLVFVASSSSSFSSSSSSLVPSSRLDRNFARDDRCRESRLSNRGPIKLQHVLLPIGFVLFFGTRQARKSCMILSLAQRS